MSHKNIKTMPTNKMKNLNSLYRITIAVLLAALCAPALAINKCIDQRGAVTFQQKPCPTIESSPRDTRVEIERYKAMRKSESEQNRKSVAASLEAQLEQQIKRRETQPQIKSKAAEPLQSTSQPMAFEQCKQAVGRTILASGQILLNTRIIVSSPTMTITRICTTDGSVLVTCNAMDGIMITTKSPDC